MPWSVLLILVCFLLSNRVNYFRERVLCQPAVYDRDTYHNKHSQDIDFGDFRSQEPYKTEVQLLYQGDSCYMDL